MKIIYGIMLASNDPKLGRREVALVLDDGTIVEFYTAEFA